MEKIPIQSPVVEVPPCAAELVDVGVSNFCVLENGISIIQKFKLRKYFRL